MKIGIISDIHGSLTAWEKAWDLYFYDTDLIINCGDILYHGPRNPLPAGHNPAKLAEALNACSVPILCAKGNCDAEIDQMLLNFPIESPYLHCYIDNKRILVHHGHHPESLAEKVLNDYDIIISGHTHLPLLEQRGKQLYLNPGSPSLPKTNEKIPTVAIIENGQARIEKLS